MGHRVKIAKDLPKPPKLTKEDLERLHEEGQKWAKAVMKGTESLERLSAEDYAVLIR
jgi:hypothetical protein